VVGHVVVQRARLHLDGQRLEARELRRVGALGGAGEQRRLDAPADVDQQQLLAEIDLGDDDAAARQHRDEVVAFQPLQRLADRRAADAHRLAQRRLGEQRAGRDLQHDDRVAQQDIGLPGQALDVLALLRRPPQRLRHARSSPGTGGCRLR